MSDTATTEETPVRYCHGCRGYDDAPRVIDCVDIHRPDLDKLYHYDSECAPAHLRTPENEAIFKARESGKKDHELRAAGIKHAASLKEAPADKPRSRATKEH